MGLSTELEYPSHKKSSIEIRKSSVAANFTKNTSIRYMMKKGIQQIMNPEISLFS